MANSKKNSVRKSVLKLNSIPDSAKKVTVSNNVKTFESVPDKRQRKELFTAENQALDPIIPITNQSIAVSSLENCSITPLKIDRSATVN